MEVIKIKKTITKNICIKQITEFVKKNGRRPLTSEFNMKYNLPCSHTVKKYFGSIDQLLIESNLLEELIIKKNNAKKEDIINQISEFIKVHGRKPMKNEFKIINNLPCPRTISLYFGSTVELFREYGLKIPLTFREIKKEDIISMIQNYHKKHGRLPLRGEFILDNDLPTVDQVRIYFRGIEDAKKASGFKVGQKKVIYTKQEVILAIQNFYEKMERLPLKGDIRAKNGFPSINKLRALFGTMRGAIEAAGFVSTGKKNIEYNIEDIEKLLLQKYIEKRRRLKSSEIIADKELPNYATVCNLLSAQSSEELWGQIEKKYKKELKYLIKS